jgi:hypothetical protein
MFHRLLAVVLCLVISTLPCWCEPPQAAQRAGEVSALIPSAERNSKPTKARDDVDWNDMLKTQHTGRLRALLTDGSTISMGSDSEMKVLQHDAKSQQTSVQMGIGAMRSRVVKLTNPGAKFEVHTPQAVIGVVGTDFYVGVTAHRTLVICYTGSVIVTPTGSAQVLKQDSSTAQQAAAQGAINVAAGSMVEVGDDIVPVVKPTPNSLQEQTIAATGVEPPRRVPPATHTVRNVIIGLAVSGAVAGAVVGTTRGGGGTCPLSQCGIAGR